MNRSITVFAALALALATALTCSSCSQKANNPMRDISNAYKIDWSSASTVPGANTPKDSFFLQDVAKVSYVALENTDKSKMEGDPRRAPWIAKQNDNIYLKSASSLFKFDSNGKFLQRLDALGDKDNQYKKISDIAMDSAKGEIIINDALSGMLKIYNLDFEFIRSVPAPNMDEICNFGPSTVLARTYPVYRQKTGISHILASTEDGRILKTFNLYGRRGVASIGSSGHKCPERSLFPFADRIYSSDLVCPDTIYAITRTDSLVRPAFYKNKAAGESISPDEYTYLYLLFDTPRYTQLVCYRKSWNNQKFYLFDKHTATLTETSLFDKESRYRGRRTWWNIPSGQDGLMLRMDECDDMIVHNRFKYQTGLLHQVCNKLQSHGNPLLTIMQF